jgi:hypothetical protein
MHRFSSESCTQRIPAGFPSGIPGIGDEMDKAMQHAPHPGLQNFSLRPVPASNRAEIKAVKT